ncbi:SUKH-4 family immunity protein [Streptomyces sp. NPDC056580]|uniref:SUKH-4 family immunity protein n=1 Tax=Streptomyces sp. NPDC056580 TaxID=3345872 RepID=UPI0036A324A5
MVTFAQAQERAEEWINGDVPAYQHREVRVREFELGFVVWGEDRAEGPRSDAGGQRLVIARDSGEATLWPALPVGEVIRRYEEEYGRVDEVRDAVPAPAAARVDLNQTSFLLSPPEWLQEAADKLGIPDRRSGESSGAVAAVADSGAGAAGPGAAGGALAETQAGVPAAAVPSDAVPGAPAGAAGAGVAGGQGSGAAWPAPGSGATPGAGLTGAPAGPEAPVAPGAPAGATPWAGTDTNADAGEDRSVPLPATVFAPPLSEPGGHAPRPPAAAADAKTALMSGGSHLPPTAVAPALGAQDQRGAGNVPPGAPGRAPGAPGAPAVGAGAAPAPPGVPPYGPPQAPAAPGTPPPPAAGPGGTPPPPPPGAMPPPPPGGTPAPPPYGRPQAPDAPRPPAGTERPLAPNAGDIADAATSKAAPPPRRPHAGLGAPPPPPGAPGTPGARPGSTPPPPGAPGAPGAPAGGYVPTQLVSALGPEGPGAAPGAPQPPGAPGAAGGTPPGDAPHAATVLATPGMPMPPPPGAPQPPGAPGVPGAPAAPGAPGAPGGGRGAVHHAETVLAAPPVGGPGAPPPPPPPAAGPPGMPPGVPGAPQPMPPGAMPPGAMPPPPPPGGPMPGRPAAYGYPQQGQPTVGPGYQAVLRYRAQDGSEQQLIRRSAPGTPHPEWQIFHELRAMNVPPDQVLELHTELESCELPGAYCARMIREQWPQARITSIAPYGTDHASRQQGMHQLLAHQGELHQVADGPARPAPVRAPLPPVQPAPPIPPEGIAQELAAVFGPGVFRFEQQAVSRQGVPPIVAHTLVVAGLPVDLGPFFWAQAQPGRPVPTLAELAAERGVQPAADAGSYLVMGTDFGKALCVQYGTANIVAVPVEAGPGGAPVPPQFVNTGLPEFARCLALLGRMWRLRHGLNQEQAGRWTVDFQAQLAALDPAALGSPESWWSVLLEQMWDGLL